MVTASTFFGFWDSWLDPMKVTFDGENRIILVNEGVTVLDVQDDLYEAWKRWVQQADNMKFVQAFRSVGGDVLSATNVVTPYFFLLNGWRLRPYEGSHSLQITGNLITQTGEDPLIPTLGNWHISVTRFVPLRAESIILEGGTSGPTASETAQAVWQTPMGTPTPAGTFGAQVKGLHNISPAEEMAIAMKVWEQLTGVFYGQDSMGERLKAQQSFALTAQDKTDIAVEVWNQPVTATYQANSFGEFFKLWLGTKMLTVSKFLGLKS